MAIKVCIPSGLREECGGQAELPIEAATVRLVLLKLKEDEPPLYRSVCDETGAVRRHVNLFVNDSIINKTAGLDVPLADGDELSIMPAVSGG